MMRLSNRIAATALAAVMAVSMLTACGGGGGGSTGGNGTPASKPNNPSSSASSSENGGTGNTGNTGTSGGNTGNSSVWINTQTYKANQILKGDKVYLNSDWSFEDESIQYEYSQKSQTSYVKERINERGSTTNCAMLVADGWLYLLEPKAVEGKNVILKAEMDDFDEQEMINRFAGTKMLLVELLTPDNPAQIKVEPQKKLGSSIYYAESYQKTLNGGKAIVTGYYQNNTLKFLAVTDNETDDVIKVKFNAYSATPNESLLKIPSNCEFAAWAENGKVYDENGNYLGEESQELKEFLD